jgi:hypothetical protein
MRVFMQQQQILIMLEMQDAMNTKVSSRWREQDFAWYRAVWIECAELMDHYGWKWWKKQLPDRDQVVLELVDIWHFGLSDLLQHHHGDFVPLAASLSDQFSHEISDLGEFRVELENFVTEVLRTRTFDTPAFCRVLASAQLSFEQLHLQYVGKNVLNFFRQDHGYKEGTYRKFWQGREDNEHLVEVLASLDSFSANFQTELYDALKHRYG